MHSPKKNNALVLYSCCCLDQTVSNISAKQNWDFLTLTADKVQRVVLYVHMACVAIWQNILLLLNTRREASHFFCLVRGGVSQMQFLCAVTVFWNDCGIAVVSDRLANVCHVANVFWWVTWKKEINQKFLGHFRFFFLLLCCRSIILHKIDQFHPIHIVSAYPVWLCSDALEIYAFSQDVLQVNMSLFTCFSERPRTVTHSIWYKPKITAMRCSRWGYDWGRRRRMPEEGCSSVVVI